MNTEVDSQVETRPFRFRRWTDVLGLLRLAVMLVVCLGLTTMLVAQGPTLAGDADTTQASESVWGVIFSGGVLGLLIMSTLIILSVLAAYLVFDQAMGLRKADLVPSDLVESVRTLLSQGKLKEADQVCRERPCPLSFVIVSGIAEVEFGWPAVEKALEDSAAEQAARLYRKLEYLSVIGNLAPMLGLLGTVSGMILAFREVAISAGSAGAADLASGIYSALVTTVAGLIIAIPSLGAFAIFRNKIDELMSEIAYSAQHAFGAVRRRIPGAAPRPTQPPRQP